MVIHYQNRPDFSERTRQIEEQPLPSSFIEGLSLPNHSVAWLSFNFSHQYEWNCTTNGYIFTSNDGFFYLGCAAGWLVGSRSAAVQMFPSKNHFKNTDALVFVPIRNQTRQMLVWTSLGLNWFAIDKLGWKTSWVFLKLKLWRHRFPICVQWRMYF